MLLLPIEREGTTSASLSGVDEVVAPVIEANVALYERRGYLPPWIGYLALEAERVVGTCGFAGPPSEGEAEIAYFTFPGHEGKGVAKRMANSLLELTGPLARQLGVLFVAHTLPGHGPSTSVLKALRFKLEGAVQHPEDGLVWKWRLSAEDT